LNIKFNNSSECNVVSTIILDYEKLRESEGRTDDVTFSKVINDLKNSVDTFVINQNIGKIGTVTCRRCQNKWTAVCAEDARHVKCRKCGTINPVPQIQKTH
jgi:PHP family Zn ribbon phosphoesterase